MPGIETPLRPLLADLTQEVNETGEEPFGAYVRLCQTLGARGLWFDTYCSSSITSGGHARNDSLSMMQVIQKNTDSAFDLGDELYRYKQLDPKETIEAVAVGKIRHWSQSDYMEFWLSVMARLPFQGAGVTHKLETLRGSFTHRLAENNVDMDRYNNSGLTADERVIEYMKHADAFASATQEMDEVSPIKRLVRLIDTDQSLGAQTENYFARVMGTNVMKVAVARIGGETLPYSFPSKRIVRDSKSIVSFGGHVFDPQRRTQVILVPDEN